MIRINLLPHERRPWSVHIGSAPGIAFILVALFTWLVIGCWFWSLSATAQRLAGEVAVAEAEATRLGPALEVVRQLESRQAVLQQRVGLIETVREAHVTAGPILQAVANATPDGLWLTELTLKERQLTLRGAARRLVGISALVANLDASGLFRHPVEIVDTEQTAGNAEGETVTFVVKATVDH